MKNKKKQFREGIYFNNVVFFWRYEKDTKIISILKNEIVIFFYKIWFL